MCNFTYIFYNRHLAPLIQKPLWSRDYVRITNASQVKWPKRTSSSSNVIGFERNLPHNLYIETRFSLRYNRKQTKHEHIFNKHRVCQQIAQILARVITT